MNFKNLKNKILPYLHKDNLFAVLLSIFVILKLYCAYSMIMCKLNML